MAPESSRGIEMTCVWGKLSRFIANERRITQNYTESDPFWLPQRFLSAQFFGIRGITTGAAAETGSIRRSTSPGETAPRAARAEITARGIPVRRVEMDSEGGVSKERKCVTHLTRETTSRRPPGAARCRKPRLAEAGQSRRPTDPRIRQRSACPCASYSFGSRRGDCRW